MSYTCDVTDLGVTHVCKYCTHLEHKMMIDAGKLFSISLNLNGSRWIKHHIIVISQRPPTTDKAKSLPVIKVFPYSKFLCLVIPFYQYCIYSDEYVSIV